jgi:hypothetical protein
MKFNLKATCLLLTLSSITALANAQASNSAAANGLTKSSSTFSTDDGAAVMTSEYTSLQGNPFSTTDWVKGDVKFADGSQAKDLQLKYSDLKDGIYMKTDNGQLGSFNMPVKEFTLYNTDGTLMHYSTFPGNGKFPDADYFQVLSDGKVKLLKKNAKGVSESKDGIGTAVVTRMIVDNVDYYLLIGGKLIRIKKDKKTIEAALGDKQPELESYIKANNLNMKRDDDMAKLITQYNSL